MRLYGSVAFARGPGETFQVGDLDMPAAVMDEIGLLQGAGDERHAVAPGTDHLCHGFLRQHELASARQVVRLQEASRQSGFDGVRGVAAGGLLNLRINRQAVPDEQRAQRRALVGRGAQAIDVDCRGHSRHQHDGAVERGWIAQRAERAQNAVAADHRDLHVIPLRQIDDERDDAAMRKIGALERVARRDQYGFLNQIGGSQVRPKQFEIIRTECR